MPKRRGGVYVVTLKVRRRITSASPRGAKLQALRDFRVFIENAYYHSNDDDRKAFFRNLTVKRQKEVWI